MRIAKVSMTVVRHTPPENRKSMKPKLINKPHWMPPRRAGTAAAGGFGATPWGARTGLLNPCIVRFTLSVVSCWVGYRAFGATPDGAWAAGGGLTTIWNVWALFVSYWMMNSWGDWTPIGVGPTLEKSSASVKSSRSNWPANMILMSLGNGLPG